MHLTQRAMSTTPNHRIEAIPVDRPSREIAAICAKHGIECGSSDSLWDLMQGLDENKHLAMDFWSFVARIGDQNPGNAEDPDWLLRIIVQGVTGQSLEELNEAGVAQRLPVRKLASMLAGEDVQTPRDRKAVQSAREMRGGPVAFTNPRLKPSESGHPEFAPHPFPLDATISPPPVTEPQRPSPETSNRRLTLEPSPPVARATDPGPGLEPPHEQPQIIIPLAAYAEQRSAMWPKLAGGTLVAAMLVGAGLLVTRNWERLNDSARVGFSSAIQAWNRPKGAPLPASSTSSTQPTTTAAASSTGATSQPSTDGAPRNGPMSQPASHQVPQQPGATGPGSQHSSRPSTSSPTVSDAREPDSTYGQQSSGGRVVVPEILMNSNLISSRDSSYTQGNHKPGRVVIQATVTRHGDVVRVHVLQGDSALRQAAIDAALSRRYKPYLLNGTPVDVSTTMSIDFAGDR